MKDITISTQSRDNFKQEFVKSLQSKGFSYSKSSGFWAIGKIQSLFVHLRYHISFPQLRRKSKLVPTNGALLIHESLPYCFYQEIVPFLWDCWPGNWDKLVYSLKLLNVNLCFVTSRQVRDMLTDRLPHLKCIYIPEAVNPNRFSRGRLLIDRRINVFEVGRKHSRYHEILKDYFSEQEGFVSDYVDDFCGTLSDSKISISFPRCATNPEMAGEVETLTERYWESMLSGCLILGHAPQELIDLLGYNPVIEVDWNNPQKQLNDLLDNIDNFQNLADKNYRIALANGLWVNRIPIIQKELFEQGYQW